MAINFDSNVTASEGHLLGDKQSILYSWLTTVRLLD